MKKIRHTGIYVSDMEAMKRFYCETFGMSISVDTIEEGKYIETVLGYPNIRINVCKLSFDDETMIELIKVIGRDVNGTVKNDIYDLGITHIAFTVGSVREMYSRLSEEKLSFISEPIVSDDGGAMVCFCRDPEGNYLELVEELKGN